VCPHCLWVVSTLRLNRGMAQVAGVGPNGCNSSAVSVSESRLDRGPRERIRLLYLGRLAEIKGVHLIIEAFDILRSSTEGERIFQTCLVSIVGDGDPLYAQKLRDACRERRLDGLLNSGKP